MQAFSDGNTGKNTFVSIQDGKILVCEDLEPEYGSSAYEVKLYHISRILLDMAQRYYDECQRLKAENARLAGRPKRPILKPSKIGSEDNTYRATKRGRTVTPNPKKSDLQVTEERNLRPHNLPSGSRFKGYKDYYVQELDIRLRYIRYRRERWQLPSGEERTGMLPDAVQGNHFGPTLRQLILYQYFHNHVTQPLLLNQLRELGISISAGELSGLLTDKNERWQQEKDALLPAALAAASYIQVGDTGAWHQGNNGFCTQIGNEQFAWFKSSDNNEKIGCRSISEHKINHLAVKTHQI